ncbi:MAG: hypothetical protein ACYSUF_06340 [Planctomycetota bacterium]
MDHDIELRMAEPMKASRSFAFDLDLVTDPEAATWTAVIGKARGTSRAHGVRQRLGARHLIDTNIPLSVGEEGSRLETADQADPRAISLGPMPKSGFSVTSALADALPILSDAPVKVGSTWTTERPIRSLETWTWGQGQLTSKHRVTAIDARQGHTLVKVTTESHAKLGPVEGEGPYNGTLERTIHWTFDATGGRLLSLSADQTTEGRAALGGRAEMPVYQRTRVELTAGS